MSIPYPIFLLTAFASFFCLSKLIANGLPLISVAFFSVFATSATSLFSPLLHQQITSFYSLDSSDTLLFLLIQNIILTSSLSIIYSLRLPSMRIVVAPRFARSYINLVIFSLCTALLFLALFFSFKILSPGAIITSSLYESYTDSLTNSSSISKILVIDGLPFVAVFFTSMFWLLKFRFKLNTRNINVLLSLFLATLSFFALFLRAKKSTALLFIFILSASIQVSSRFLGNQVGISLNLSTLPSLRKKKNLKLFLYSLIFLASITFMFSLFVSYVMNKGSFEFGIFDIFLATFSAFSRQISHTAYLDNTINLFETIDFNRFLDYANVPFLSWLRLSHFHINELTASIRGSGMWPGILSLSQSVFIFGNPFGFFYFFFASFIIVFLERCLLNLVSFELKSFAIYKVPFLSILCSIYYTLIWDYAPTLFRRFQDLLVPIPIPALYTVSVSTMIFLLLFRFKIKRPKLVTNNG